MKIIKQITLVFLFSFFATQTYSQSFSANISYLNSFPNSTFANSDMNSLGAVLAVEGPKSDKFSIIGSLGLYAPYTASAIISAEAKNDFTNPRTIPALHDMTTTLIPINLGLKIYFVGGYESDFSIYGTGSIGCTLGTIKNAYSGYNYALYEITSDYFLNEPQYDTPVTFFASLTGDAGLGAQIKLGIGYLFAEGKYAMPIFSTTNLDSSPKDAPISAGLIINVGYKIPLDDY